MPMLAGRFVLTLPARISPRKGQDDFLALIAALQERGIPVHGLLAGGADRPERLSALIGDMLWHLPHLRAIARAGTAGSVTLLTKRRSQADRLLAAEPAVGEILWVERNPGRHDGVSGILRLAHTSFRHIALPKPSCCTAGGDNKTEIPPVPIRIKATNPRDFLAIIALFEWTPLVRGLQSL